MVKNNMVTSVLVFAHFLKIVLRVAVHFASLALFLEGKSGDDVSARAIQYSKQIRHKYIIVLYEKKFA
jgi:hypothetical protein